MREPGLPALRAAQALQGHGQARPGSGVAPQTQTRWDGDRRGRGVADGRRLVPGLRELLASLELPDWVAEHPKVHLLPHLSSACARADAPFGLEAARVDADGALELTLRWRGRVQDARGVRAAAFALVGEVAESATYVRQLAGPGGGIAAYEVATGMLAPDTHFAPHGHILVLRILGAEA